ncbi:MAG: hypothetical protein HQL14_00085 [Candidatus Omnitrophica bacterium]|nr:hypothetical protein [Candidatus Omnitrophota bacterium]
MIYSFDIFDTTLTRSVARPKDIFRLMQRKLSGYTHQFPRSLIDHFYSARLNAEFSVRLSSYLHKKPEITLKDIYETLCAKFPLNQQQCRDLMDLEMATEYESIYPIAWTLSQILSLRQNKERIIFVSDMYLPIDFIERLLVKVGAYQKHTDKIYLSSTLGVAKLDGGLFRYILEQEQCQPSEICHYGDDIQSDVYVPFKMGINIYGSSLDEVHNTLKSYSYKKMQKYIRYIFQC